MKTPLRLAPLFALLFHFGAPARAAVVINEIMFHPQGAPENVALEWVELHNNSTAAIDLTGCRFTRGIDFLFPNGTMLGGGGFVVVAANVAQFQAAHPGVTNVVGNWIGRLSNSGEKLRVENANGQLIDEVSYADDGDWAVRARGPLSFGHRGWIWVSDADGAGKSLERRNRALTGLDSGQNWGPSVPPGGTPGAANSLASANIAPLIFDVKHRPEIPRANQSIVVSANFVDDAGANLAAILHWRLDAGTWQTGTMSDTDGDGDREATIPGQANLSVLEFYIEASDATNSRTWPAPARTSNPGVTPETYAQVTNALILVDDAFNPNATFTAPGNQPVYRLTMTDAERSELARIGSTPGEEDSEATMNGTFVSHDGSGLKVVYNAGFRNRGFASALGPPNNYNVRFRSDDRWNGRSGMQLNCQFPYSQALGNTLFERAGIAPQQTAIVQVRVNGANLAQTGARMYGRYARLEGRGGEWAERHYPNDSEGNFYRLDDHEYPQGDPRSGELSYEGSDPAAYSDTFFKETNQDANDYSDLIEFARVVSAPPAGGTVEQPAIPDSAYPAAVAARLDLDQFYRYIATDALIGNQEGGLQSGRADDVSMYRGVLDPRFRFIPHDLDDIFDIGSGVGNPVTRSIFSYDISGGGVQGLRRLFNHPQLVPRYYAALLEALDDWFNSAAIDPIIDQIMAGWVPLSDGSAPPPATSITEIKAFVAQRRANVLGQIQQSYSLNVTTGAPDTAEGFRQTTDGGATIGGTFNVAQTYSVTVNGTLAQHFYRAQGADAAGTWKLVVAPGSTFLRRGLNRIVVNFHDGINGTGQVLRSLSANIFYSGGTPTTVSGTLAPAGAVTMIAPAAYVPGVPVLVRVDLRDPEGNLDRQAWNRTATLTATNGVSLNPATVPLYNGMGSALVTIGGGGGGGTQNLFTYGVYPGTPGSSWKYRTDLTSATIGSIPANWKDEGFDDSAWPSAPSQIGYGDSPRDEATLVPVVDYNGATTGAPVGPSYLFRNTFTIANVAELASVTGQVKFDDACAVYVNGTEIYRTTPDLSPGAPLTQYTEANTPTTRENATANLTVPLNLLHNGVNTIAVEVHQHDAASSDMTFDLRLAATLPGTDPGNFTLTADVGGVTAAKALTSLAGQPATSVSGTLPGSSTWSGIVRVTGDVTIPSGATLTIQPGTHVLIDGNATVGSSTGSDLIVQSGGSINAVGTLASPISLTSSVANTRWGEINATGASTWRFCLISHACHSPGGGHTGTGPVFRLGGANTNFTLEDSVVSDNPGKTMTNSGSPNIVIRRTHLARGVMGPELDNATITLEDSNLTDMLPIYRESGGPDDEDCIYIHDSGGRPVNLRRIVLANCGDDALDCLGGNLTVEDSIIRNAFDKGVSLLDNDVVMRRCQIIDNDIGVSTKCAIASENAPFLNVFENCTVVSENHPTNTGDGDFHSIGFHTRNKYGTTTMNITVQVKNCIVSAEEPVRNDYATAGTPFPLMNFTYTDFHDLGGALPNDPVPSGTGNITANPLYVSFATDDFHLQPASPARDTGDPASPLDPDGSRADMGALRFGSGGGGGTGTLTWTPAGGPYLVAGNTLVPAGLTLVIQAGTNVQFNQNARLRVNGKLQVLGTADAHVVFSHVPGTIAVGDCDPIKNGVQTGPPKWGGVRIYDSLSEENIVRYADFINAQGTDPATDENFGSLGFIRSWGWVDHCTFAGTHLRMCYGRNPKLTVTHSVFPDMFLFDPVLNRIEVPGDFLASADNRMEPLKVEYPTTDPEVAGNPAYPNGLPAGGHWRVYYNDFNGNRGHQDVFDADSGRWGQPGQFVLDCRYNTFHGLAGDEHIDLGGDAYVAHNRFYTASKDEWTIDTGYSNAISTGDKGNGTTIFIAGNIFYDLDHAINCKNTNATIFEHNTCIDFHQDWQYNHIVTQFVACGAVNLFVPNDGNAAGDGGYLGYNIFHGNLPSPDDPAPDPPGGFPRLFSWADRDVAGAKTSRIQLDHNFIDPAILDTTIGANHPGGIFSPSWGTGNIQGDPMFTDKSTRDFSLAPGSPAKGTAPGGLDYGATIPEWAYILGGPNAQTNATSATFSIGGPGIVAYKWRRNGGAWSAPIQIGSGALFPRGSATVRQAVLNLTGLTNGTHTLEVLGQDMAGNWQDADPARTIAGLPQAAPTSRTWVVNTALQLVRINEVLADSNSVVDSVELHNAGAADVTMNGWTISDAPIAPERFNIPAGTVIPAGGFYVFTLPGGLTLDKDGDAVALYKGPADGLALVDSVSFGPQIRDLSIGRIGPDGEWTLCQPSLGAANVAQTLGSPASVRINEWFADGEVLYDTDWIELRNLGAVPVPLAGVVLTDNTPGNPAGHQLPPLSFIGPNGYLRLLADGDPSLGAAHLGFQLEAEQEQIALFDPEGLRRDFVIFGPQPTDYSQGRDATGNFLFYELPTRPFLNGTTDPAYPNALALLRGLRITEIMFNAIGGNDYEYLELRNVGATPLALGGTTFVEGIDFTFPAMTLAPGQEVLVVKNVARFRARYGAGPLVAGSYGGQLDNNGERLALQLPPPFDANILTFRFNELWYAGTNGAGRSLVLLNPLIAASQFGDRDAWRASAEAGGNPGGATVRSDTYSGWTVVYGVAAPGSDDDRDGIPALVEYSLGMNPTDPNGVNGRAGAPQVARNLNGRLELRLLIPVNPAAAQGHGMAEAIYNVQASNDLVSWSTIASKSTTTPWTGIATVTVGAPSGGLVPLAVEDPGSATPPRYLRLQTVFAP